MGTVINFPLRDGALLHIPPGQHHDDLIERMAAHLIEHDAWQDEHDAVLSLYGCRRFKTFEVMVHVNNARQLAMVTVEMLQP